MIKGFVNGQGLKVVTAPIVSDTVNYLEAEFEFVGEAWNDPELLKYAFFKQGDTVRKIRITDDKIVASRGINLAPGQWEVSVLGCKPVPGFVPPAEDEPPTPPDVDVQITTSSAAITVSKTWVVPSSGDPFEEYTYEEGRYLLNSAEQAAARAHADADAAATSAASSEKWATGGSGGTASTINNAKHWAEISRGYADGRKLDATQNPQFATDNAKFFRDQAHAWADGTGASGSQVDNYAKYWAKGAADSAEDAADSALDAEAWAKGTKHGEPVQEGDAQYENNAKYYAELPVTTDRIADGAVTEAKLADGAVTGEKLGSKAVKTANIDDGAVGNDQLASAVKTTIAGKADSSALAASGGAALIGVIPPDGSQGVTSVQGYFYALEENGAYYIHALDNDGVTLIRVQDYLDRLAAAVAAKIDRSEALPAIYNAYATDGAAGVLGFKTTLGADGIPAKTTTVTQTSGTPTTWTIRRLGKNHFSRDSVTFKIGYLLTSSGGESANNSYMYTETYIPVLPNTEYVFSGIYPTGNTGTGAPVSCYRADKSFIERKSSGVNTNPKFTTPPDCRYIRFNCPTARAGSGTMNTGNKIAADIDIQIEIGTVATDPAAYTQKDYTVPITALDTPTEPTEMLTTLRGDNVVLLLGQADAAATVDITARLDPTLVYSYLKAAIVAAGTT